MGGIRSWGCRDMVGKDHRDVWTGWDKIIEM